MIGVEELEIALFTLLLVIYAVQIYRERSTLEPSAVRVLLYSVIAFVITFILQIFIREPVEGYCSSMTLGYAALFLFSVIWGAYTGYSAGIGLGLASSLLNPSYGSVIILLTGTSAGALVGWLAKRHREASLVILASIAGGTLIFSGEALFQWIKGNNPLECLEPLAVSLVTAIMVASAGLYFEKK